MGGSSAGFFHSSEPRAIRTGLNPKDLADYSPYVGLLFLEI